MDLVFGEYVPLRVAVLHGERGEIELELHPPGALSWLEVDAYLLAVPRWADRKMLDEAPGCPCVRS